jgi:23S rRNA (cytosine1962-C5)-methyltransferase
VKRVRLKTTRAGGSPIIFRKMVASADPGTGNGEVVEVVDARDRVLGRGFFNRKSTLALRILEYGEGDDLGPGWLRGRLMECVRLRQDTLGLGKQTDAYRVVNSEGDGLSGLVADRFGEALVLQIGSLGWYRRIVEVKDILRELLGVRRIEVRAVSGTESIEGFRIFEENRAPAPVTIRENGVKFEIDPAGGHKTGFFLDQREHRMRLQSMAHGLDVLDLCCYTGGFSLSAAKGGARRVLGVDLDEEAVAGAAANAARNGKPASLSFRHADAYDVLRDARPGEWDIIICDPPKLAAKRGDLPKARRAYGDLAQLAFEKVRGGGIVVSCSCSGLVSEDDFLGILTASALRAERTAQVFHVGGAGADHPWSLRHPNGRYLKVVWSRVRGGDRGERPKLEDPAKTSRPTASKPPSRRGAKKPGVRKPKAGGSRRPSRGRSRGRRGRA